MEYALFVIVLLIAYPVFMLVAFILSKVIFKRDEEFEYLDAKQKSIKHKNDRSLAHV